MIMWARLDRHPQASTVHQQAKTGWAIGQRVGCGNVTSGAQAASSPGSRHPSLWVRELAFGLVLILTTLGVAYTIFSKQPIIAHWEVLAPIIGIVCIGAIIGPTII
jgi:hypothetical protein